MVHAVKIDPEWFGCVYLIMARFLLSLALCDSCQHEGADDKNGAGDCLGILWNKSIVGNI